MIHVSYSNCTEALWDAFAERLSGEPRTRSPLEALVVLVPHPLYGERLKIHAAGRLGHATNLRCLTLGGFLRERLGLPQAAGPVHALVGHLLGRFCDPGSLSDPVLEPVRTYVEGDGRAADLRRVQLSRALAGRLNAGSRHHPDFRQRLATWANESPTGRWQHHLVASLPSSVSLSVEEAFLRSSEPARGEPETVHALQVFPSTGTEKAVFVKLLKTTNVFAYLLNPCGEFWEQSNVSDPMLLNRWGSVRRQQTRLAQTLAEGDFSAHYVSPPLPTNRLERLQRAHLLGSIDPLEATITKDTSCTVQAYASLDQEVEATTRAILDEVTHRCTSLSEIAVIIPRDRAYRTVLARNLQLANLPYAFFGVPLAECSRTVDFIKALLATPESRFSQREMLWLATHPLFRSIGEDRDPEHAKRLCRSAGIVHGRDGSDHAGTYIERDLYTWSHGLEQLALQVFRGTQDRFSENLGNETLSENFSTEEVGALIADVRSLIDDATFLRSGPHPLPVWWSYLRSLLLTYVKPDNDTDDRDLSSCLRLIERLEELDGWPEGASFSVVSELFVDALETLRTTVGPMNGDVLSIGPLEQLQGLRFRQVFVLGGSEGRLLPRESPDPLLAPDDPANPPADLKSETGLEILLDFVTNTADSLRFSYVDNGEREPAKCTEDLLEAMAQLELVSTTDGSPEDSQPSHRTGFFDCAAPSAFGNSESSGHRAPSQLRRILTIREDLARNLGAGAFPTDLDLRTHLSRNAYARLGNLLGIPDASGAPNTDTSEADRTVPIQTLYRFVHDPLATWIQFHFGTFSSSARPSDFDEPFEMEGRLVQQVLASVLATSQADRRLIQPTYLARLEPLGASGLLPTGVFLRSEQQLHLDLLVHWADLLCPFLETGAYALALLDIGPGRQEQTIRFPTRGGSNATLGGKTQLLLIPNRRVPGQETVSVALHTGRTVSSALRTRMLASSQVDRFAFSVATQTDNLGRHRSLILTRDDAPDQSFSPPTGLEESRIALRELLTKLCNHVPPAASDDPLSQLGMEVG
jgi:exonuclease V gamma subunit